MASDDSKPGDAPKEVTIKSFGTREQAELAMARLEANGIACRIAADDCAGFLPNLTQAQGVRVLVPGSSADAARELLDLPAAPVSETIIAGASEPVPPPSSKISIAQILFGIAVGALAMWALQGGVRPKP